MRRGRTARDVPPPLELECLRALWALGDSNVQSVKDYLTPSRPLAYTTVMTMLERLTRKQILSRRKVGRAFVYSPLLNRDEVRQRAVGELVDSLFNGSRQELLQYLQGRPEAPSSGDSGERIDAVLL